MRKYVQPTLGFFSEGHGPNRKVHPITIKPSATGRERLRRKTRLKLPKGKDKGEEKEKGSGRKDARLGSFRGVGAQKELPVGSKPPTKAA